MNNIKQPLGWALMLAVFSFLFMACNDDKAESCTMKATASAEKNTITVNATGGATPYQYKLNNGEFSSANSFSDLAAGDYTVTVKDAKNCTATTSAITISTCDASTLAVSAKGEAYTITASAMGGEGTYQYSIDGTTFEPNNTFEVNEAKAYTVTVKDAKGCTSTAEVQAEAITTFTDKRDNQTYKVVKIGDQVWLAENFNYQIDGSYCYAGANESETTANCEKYGRLYTWSAAKAAAPQGWHLPIEAEWNTLLNKYAGVNFAGPSLKEGGSSGFNFLLGGARSLNGSFNSLEQRGNMWIATDGTGGSSLAKKIDLQNDNLILEDYGADKKLGYSVRYIKDI